MCTYLNGRLIAFTGTLPPVVTLDPNLVQPMITSGEREPIRFDDNGPVYKGSRHLCNKHNCGRKPEYKDRHLRAAGSGKVRKIPTVISR